VVACVGNVLPGVAGALIGLVGVLLGAWVTGRNQDQRWLREQKLKSAADFITAGLHLYESQLESSDQRRLTTADRVAWQDKLQTGRSHIHLLCRDETRESADKFASLVWREDGTKNVQDQADVVKVLRAFNKHLRREIRSDR
jgi:acyl-CoA reductase-like NAD-dependent aldehyde dehydrogenase